MEFPFVWGWQGPSTIQKNESAGSSTSVGSFIPRVSTDVISPVGSYSWLQTAVNQHVKSLLKGTQSCLRLWKLQRKRFLSRPGEAVCWHSQGHPRETLKTPRGECSLTTTLILSSEMYDTSQPTPYRHSTIVAGSADLRHKVLWESGLRIKTTRPLIAEWSFVIW